MRAMLAGLAAVVGCTPFTASERPSYESTVAADREVGVVRVATWNIEDVGSPGSTQYEAAVEVLERIDVDVLALNEIQGSWDVDNAEALAEQLGYDHVVIGGATYGSDRNAIFSRYPFVDAASLDAADLSGDSDARDITRDFVWATIDAPGGVFDLVSMHWKSGWEDDDEFRRVLEGHRAASLVHDAHPVILAGDWNDDLDDRADSPSHFDSLPFELPSSFWLGGDLWNELQQDGFTNDPFDPLFDAGLDILEPLQRSGTDATRPTSGRRLDYLAVTLDLDVRAAEVFDCHDEQRAGDLVYAGNALGWDTCDDAADHLPVVMDVFLGEAAQPTEPLVVSELQEGQLVFSEILANPDACSDSDGEWIEVHNTTDRPIELAGLELVDASGNLGTVGEGLVGPGDVALLGRGDSPCGIQADATYTSGLSLNNGGDALSLWAGSTLLDTLDYGGSAVDPDISWGTDGATWCQTEPTPGAANASCD